MSNVVPMRPRGRYLAQEVGQLAGVSGVRIGQWANYGYIRASQSAPGEYPRIYSFQDVAEAIIVHELLEQKVPLEVLRPIIEALRERYGDWPLQRASLETVGGPDVRVASLLVKDGDLELELGEHGWQIVEKATVNPSRVGVDLSRGGWAARGLPDLEHVEIDPDRHSGAPVIRGKRVPVSLVVELADTLDGDETLREDYDLTPDEIHDAQRWWEAVRSYQRTGAAA